MIGVARGREVRGRELGSVIFSVPRLIDALSHITPLLPGDLIFTGTPSGVGAARKLQRFLTASSLLETSIEGIGTMTTTFRKGHLPTFVAGDLGAG